VKLRTWLLELLDLDRDPAGRTEFDVDYDKIVPALAHLAGQDGKAARLVRCNSSGRLEVALTDAAGTAVNYLAAGCTPLAVLLTDLTGLPIGGMSDGKPRVQLVGTEYLAEVSLWGGLGVGGLLDMTAPEAGAVATVASGTVATIDTLAAALKTVRLAQNKDLCKVYNSASAGAKTNLIGILPANVVSDVIATLQYVDIESLGSAAAWSAVAVWKTWP